MLRRYKIFNLAIVVIFIGLLFSVILVSAKNGKINYQKSNFKFSETFKNRDECSMNKYERGIMDIEDISEGSSVKVNNFFFSPGLNTCLYAWTQKDKNSKIHYFIKEASTQKIIFELSPYNIYQRIFRMYNQEYFSEIIVKISEIPNIHKEVEKLNQEIIENGPIKKCATAEEIRDWVSACQEKFELGFSGIEEDGIEKECDKDKIKKELIRDYKLFNIDSFGYSRIEMKELDKNNFLGITSASNYASQNDLLKEPLYFNAFWDGDCWNLTGFHFE
ncbi:MAG: hypothetical protein V1770_04550 [bacterium]